MRKEVIIFSDKPHESETAMLVKHELRTKFGHYAVKNIDFDNPGEYAGATVEIYAQDIPVNPEQRSSFVADIVTEQLFMDSIDLSCRDDHAKLNKYRTDDDELDITQDPRDWIYGNSLIAELGHNPSYTNLIDFVTEQRGLFIKPARYANQRNYWNAPSNAGLPIVKKRDIVHEGTFMLHDIFHFAFQDPLPVSLDNISLDSSRRAFLIHRMASEASTLVLADMVAVQDSQLAEKGYDVNKRGIYPVYRDILQQNPNIDTETLIRANLDFCFTGSISSFRELGANHMSLERFKDKYEVFFSADFDWNEANFNYCNNELTSNPELRRYYEEVRSIYEIDTIDSLYENIHHLTIDEVADSFIKQLRNAYAHKRATDDLPRVKKAATKYLAGQLMTFYKYNNSTLKQEFIDESHMLTQANSLDSAKLAIGNAQAVLKAHLDHLKDIRSINTQEYKLFMMHYPLYPAHFLHYDTDANKYKNLSEKINELKI